MNLVTNRGLLLHQALNDLIEIPQPFHILVQPETNIFDKISYQNDKE